MVRAESSISTGVGDTDFALDGLLSGIGVLAIVVGVFWGIINPGGFIFLPLGLLGLLLVAGGALMLVAGMLGRVGNERTMTLILTVLVVVSAIVATIVTAALDIL